MGPLLGAGVGVEAQSCVSSKGWEAERLRLLRLLVVAERRDVGRLLVGTSAGAPAGLGRPAPSP